MFNFSDKLIVIFTIFSIMVKSDSVKSSTKDRSQVFLGRTTQMFAVDLFSKLGEGNQLFSPLLIQSGLSVLPTKDLAKHELIKTLHLMNIDYWTNSYRTFLSSTLQSKDIGIKIGSSIYLTNNIIFPNAYKRLLQMYGTTLKSADFTKPAIVAKEINQWVERKTNNKIHDIVDSSVLSPNTEALLVTALYFNGNWVKPFEEEATHPAKFYLNGEREVTVNMMMQSSKFNYAENAELDAKFLELPYKNLDYVMTLVLPNKKNGLENLERKIIKIFAAQNYTEETTIINLPKFNLTNKIELTDALKKLGLTKIFDNGLSFANLLGQHVKVDDVIQKTYIDVNEVGTEAAAVMEVEMSARFGKEDFKTFNADHPFLFFIKQKSSGVILFLGRFANSQ